MATYKLSGSVINKKTREGMPNLHVQTWDKDADVNEPLGKTITDAEGHFVIEFDDAAFSNQGKDPNPDIFVKIFSGKTLVHSTKDQPIEDWTQEHQPLIIELIPPEDEQPFVVEGEVVKPDGKPLPNCIVRAFDRALCAWRLLGDDAAVVRTNDLGRYRLTYDPKQLKAWGKARADLKVQVFDPTGDEVLAASPLILQALPREVVNFSIGKDNYRGPDEYSQVEDALRPLLESRDDLSCIGVADALILARASGQAPTNVAYYVKAQIWSAELDLPAVVFYGLLRENGSTQKSALFVQPLSVLWRSLENAVALNLINIPLNEALRVRLSEVQQAYLNDPKQSYTKLLQTTALDIEQRDTFTRLLTSGTYTHEKFWPALKEAGFTQPQIQDLQETFELQSITGNTSLAVHLRGALDVRQPELIAAFSVAQWEEVVAAEGVGIPDDVLPGEADEVRQKMYAQALYHNAEINFPTPSLAGQMSRSTTWANPDVSRFLEEHSDFEFEEERITLLLAEQPDILGEFSDPDAVRTDLLRLEQLFHLTEHSDKLVTIEALWNSGLHSAPQIAAAGRQHLRRRVPDVDGQAVNRIYRKALHMTSFALNLYISNHPGVNRLTTNALRGRQLSQEQELARAAATLPEWEELFGSADACECTHCQSALSPAAYLVHIMDYLQRATDDDGNNALDEILRRRPDLGTLQLTCDNTDTELPKIDLLVEIMEEIVAHSTDGQTIPATGFGQTTWESDLLAAQPERMVPEAYEILRDAVYPFDRLPFDLWLVESRRYLQQMGVAREQLMRLLPHHTGVGATEIAMETLGMGSREHAIIRVPDTRPEKLAEYWGVDLARGPLPVQLGKVEKLLRQANIDYGVLLLWLNTRYVNPDRSIAVSFGAAPCSLDAAELVDVNGDPLDAETIRPFLDRLHRFLRLQRRLDCTGYELDSLLAALGFEDFNQAGFIVQLARVQTLRKTLDLSITELGSWWAPLSTFSYEENLASQYESIFLNPAVFPDTAVGGGTDLRNDVFALTGDRSDLVITQSTTLDLWLAQWNATTETYELDSDYAAYIQSATRLTSADITLLVAEVLPKGTDGHVVLNLANVSLLYRIGSFTRALKISIADYLRLDQLTGIAALTTPDRIASPVDSAKVRDLLIEIDANEWSLEELVYLLLHETEAAATLGPKVEDMDRLRDELSTALVGIDSSDAADPLEAARQNAGARAALTQSLGNSLDLDSGLLEDLLFTHRSGIGDDLIINLMLALDPARTDLPAPVRDFYQVYETLHKFALAWNPMGLDATHLAFVLDQGPGLGWTDIAALPLEAIDTADLDSWLQLTKATGLQASLFSVEQSLFGLLAAALEARDFPAEGMTRETFLAQASEWTLWNSEDVTYLTGPAGFDYAYPDDFCNSRWLGALDVVFAVQRRLGVSAAQAHTWARAELTFVESGSIKQALILAYDPDRWLEVMAGIQDDLRILKRDALLGYLLGSLGTKDSTDFYNHYLVDPEVDPCLKTSRMVEAHAAAQLFAQRILLNLEGTFKFTPEDAEGWQWRKNYRVWEAACKIFLFPENWMEPEWRDDKSEFFKALEDGLLQDDVTQQSAERLYREYLYKLDQVSRLEIMGMYEDVDEVKETNTMHVFGRTKGIPHLCYYRRWENKSRWTPWEKVDLDIDSDHLIPVVYNGRLYLFWPDFKVRENIPDTSDADNEIAELENAIEELDRAIAQQEAHIEETKDSVPEPHPAQLVVDILNTQRDEKVDSKESWEGIRQGIIDATLTYHIELGMAWSQYNGNRWSAKTLTKQAQIYIYDTDSGEKLHQFTGWVSSDNRLRIEVFTLPFAPNGEALSDIHTEDKELRGYFSFNECGAELVFSLPNESPAYSSPKGEVFTTGAHHQFNHWSIYTTTLQLNLIGDIDKRLLLRDLYVQYSKVYYAPQYGLGGSETSPFFLAADSERTYFVQPLPEVTVVPDLILYDPPGLEASPGHILLRQKPPGPPVALPGQTKPQDTLTHYENISSDQIIDRTVGASPLGTVSDLNQDIKDILVKDEVVITRPSQAVLVTEFLYRFERFYHPYTCLFLKQLFRYGIEGLLNPDPDWDDDSKNLYRQLTPLEEFDFEATYEPVSDWVTRNYTSEVLDEKIDFDHDSAYGLYSWELFFHIPLTIATRLMHNQNFDEALRWFHYIFNPTSTDGDGPERFWKIKPFYEEQLNGPIETLSELIDLLKNQRDQMEKQVEAWEQDPFNPYVIGRLRTAAFMKTTVMKYLNCLIAKADMLFTMGTREFVNEAAQYYMLAGEILGERPTLLPEQEPVTYTPNLLLGRVNVPEISLPRNPLDLLTSLFPAMGPGAPSSRTSAPVITDSATSSQGGTSAYATLCLFCLPHNEILYGYWDTVADRIFKIRHCMNIEGQVRQLPLFAAPIDPSLLVSASAAGLDISSIISGLYAPLPNYRFSFLLQKALEICGEVRNLGSSLLSALANRDGEELSLLRSTHEVSLLQAVRELKKKSIEEAESSLASLTKSKESAEFRRDYYSSLERVSSGEQKSLDALETSKNFQLIAQLIEIHSGLLHHLPNVSVTVSVSPSVSVSSGGSNLGSGEQAVAASLRAIADAKTYESNKAGTMAGYDRRLKDWRFQADLAKKEIEQLDKQILAAEIRKQIAENDLENHEQQIAQAEEVEEFLKLKFTSQQLYSWMVSKLSTLYFQAYQLAFQLAKQAERTFQHELGPAESSLSFIQPTYWDSLKKGLLAGEQLNHDLRRMETAHLEANRRELEITKHISLMQLDPKALLELRATGECEIRIPEVLFDMDFAGQYFRRIKGVRITIPCVTGPYTNVAATLSLTRSWTRRSTTNPTAAPTLDDYTLPQSAIATSIGKADGGMFEWRFEDPRYLPFEGAGVVSEWKLSLPTTLRPFDYDSISDVVIHLSYTARDSGNDDFKQSVKDNLLDNLNSWIKDIDNGASLRGPTRLISLRQELPTAWNRLLYPSEGQPQEAVFELSKQHFPKYLDYIWEEEDDEDELENGDGELTARPLTIQFDENAADILLQPRSPGFVPNPMPQLSIAGLSDIDNGTNLEITLSVSGGTLEDTDWKDLYLLLRYEVV